MGKKYRILADIDGVDALGVALEGLPDHSLAIQMAFGARLALAKIYDQWATNELMIGMAYGL